MDTKRLIKKCSEGERKAQKLFFDIYSDMLFSVASRYCKNQQESEDVLLKAFLKIFDALSKFEFINESALTGWLKKIVINEALMENRKNIRTLYKIEFTDDFPDNLQITNNHFSDDELMNVIKELPVGYRTVFLMYVVDGYSHKEIGTVLEISESTSRSQFFKARKLLREKLNVKNERVS